MSAALDRDVEKRLTIMEPNSQRYVLITPARNEGKFIELTIRAVISQSCRPIKWVIVSDGSTDGTDDIVKKYALEHSWIELITIPARQERHFSGKADASRAGFARVSQLEFDFVGSLDADISFHETYFAFLLKKLSEDLKLGLVGTPFKENESPVYDYRFVSIEHVSGACQLFRRQCFEEIGGYVPVKGGGIDYIAVVTARMKGWKTRTFTESVCIHHRRMGSAQRGVIAARIKLGAKDYALGHHPAWELLRACYQMSRRPYLVGGLALLAGFLWALIRRVERPVSHEFVEFARREQMGRLRTLVAGKSRRTRRLPDPGECA